MVDDDKEEPAKKENDVDDAKKEPAKKENHDDDAKEEPAKKELWIPLSSPSRSRALAVHQGAPPSFKTVHQFNGQKSLLKMCAMKKRKKQIPSS